MLYCSPSQDSKASEPNMQQERHTPASKRLVLLGGGHSHLAVLMYLAEHPLPGLDITLVTKDVETPYSGALPAYIDGSYSRDDLFIDLRPLALMAGARLIQASVDSLDLPTRQLHCPERPPIHFDYLSINIGSQPDTSRIAGAAQFGVAVKPISSFLEQWQQIQRDVAATQAYSLTIVGGGPASVELACAMQQRLHDSTSSKSASLHIHILSSAKSLLSGHSRKAQALATKALRDKGIVVHNACELTRIAPGRVYYQAQDEVGTLTSDCCIIATGASPARWLQHTGLALDAQGFIRVNDRLQSLSHPFVFAAGDVASIAGQERPKAGVYAVRQGMPLARNLRNYALAAALHPYKAQRYALALLSLGAGIAIATRGPWATQGRWAGRWKDWIDRRFVSKYSTLPDPGLGANNAAPLSVDTALLEAPVPVMRCSGCAAKLSSSSLGKVLTQLHSCTHEDIVSSLHSCEDASIIRIDAQRLLLQSVDHLHSFINDPYVFARIASNHCLSDIYAMGATPHSALAIVGLPHAAAPIMEDQLQQVMSACTQVLNAHNTALLGGHTSESETLSFGLSINAFAAPDKILRKHGMREGDVLILSKALGTGTLLAADMRLRARHRWIQPALAQMQRSNQVAAGIFQEYGAHACTDVTGFGLLGHLSEMISRDACELSIALSALPVLDGALECLSKGIVSSLHKDNASHANLIRNAEHYRNEARYALLFDPQTAGGLIAAIPEHAAQSCLTALHRAGDRSARCIAKVLKTNATAAAITLSD